MFIRRTRVCNPVRNISDGVTNPRPATKNMGEKINEKVKKEEDVMTAAEKASAKMTQWIGTPASVLLHTVFFIGIFILKWFGYPLEEILLILTTVVSLEAIYLAIFIQMTINRQEAKLHEVREDIEEISEDIEELGEDVEEIGKDVDELSEDVEEIGKDVDELSEDVEEIGKDVDELGEDFEEITEDMEEEEKKEEVYRSERNKNLQKIETTLQSLIVELEKMKEKK